MLSESRIGQTVGADSAVIPIRSGNLGEIMVGKIHGDLYEQAYRGKSFFAASQAATTWSVALNTTHTGFVLSNRAGSGVYLVPNLASFALSVAPAAIAHIGIFTGYDSGGIITHTTPLSTLNCFLGRGRGVGLADGAATLVGTPAWTLPAMGGFTAGALHGTTPQVLNLHGQFIIPPGGYMGIGALTAVIGFAGMTWEEVEIV